jgi:glucose-1-phosphate adenylyltransferase
MAHPKILAVVLAGGKGERLFPLTAIRSKPSVPFGGRYRIADFVLSNMVNSHIYSIYLMVQYKSQSLIEHIRQNWTMSAIIKDHFITVVPPQMRTGPEWFQGTADAIFQNINIIREHNPGLVVVFGADHVYRMDIRQMIDFHLRKDAGVTVAARPVPIEQASAFGIIATDDNQRITGFREKPKVPPHMPGRPDMSFASMGNYIFSTNMLLKALATAQRKKQHDFGAHILPNLVETGKRVFAYDFATNDVPGTQPYEEIGYWRDVGTISAFFEAHMDMLGPKPAFDVNNRSWPINSGAYIGAPARILRGNIHNSLIAEGAVINGSKIRNSIIRTGVTIEKGASIEDCIIMDNVIIKKNCKLKRVIVDKSNIVEEGEQIGFDPDQDRFRCHIDVSGICIIPKGGRRVRKKSR